MVAMLTRRVGYTSVLVNPETEVYVLTGGDALLAATAYPGWVAGCYDRTAEETDISSDLRYRVAEVWRNP